MRGCGVSRVWTSSLVVNGTILCCLHVLCPWHACARSAKAIDVLCRSIKLGS